MILDWQYSVCHYTRNAGRIRNFDCLWYTVIAMIICTKMKLGWAACTHLFEEETNLVSILRVCGLYSEMSDEHDCWLIALTSNQELLP